MKPFAKKMATLVTLIIVQIAVIIYAMNGHCDSGEKPESANRLQIREKFEPGVGYPIGEIVLAEGETAIVHSGDSFGYQGRKNLPVFTGDTFITYDDGLIRLLMKDKSQLMFSRNTKITINVGIYDPKAKTRTGFVKMVMGIARYIIPKMHGYRRSDYKIKTHTAILGVRGSDFVVETSETLTEITTFEDTELRIVAIAAPEDAVIMGEFQRVRVDWNGLISEPERLMREDIERIRGEFLFSKSETSPIILGTEPIIIVPRNELISPEEIGKDIPNDVPITATSTSAQIETYSGLEDRCTWAVEVHREGTLKGRSFDGFPVRPTGN